MFEAQKVSNCSTILPVKKYVSFDSKQVENIPFSSTTFKPIIFNGTFPIDCPITNEAEDYVDDDEFYYKEDNGEENQENYSDSETSLVPHNFLVNKRIGVNYKEMCADIENSLTHFENFVNRRRKSIYLQTFEIDAPIEVKKSV